MAESPVTRQNLPDEHNHPFESREETSSSEESTSEESSSFDYINDDPYSLPYQGSYDPDNWDLD